MKQHCYCNMLDSKQGGMVDANEVNEVRDDMPMCADFCLRRYERSVANRDQRTFRFEREERT